MAHAMRVIEPGAAGPERREEGGGRGDTKIRGAGESHAGSGEEGAPMRETIRWNR